MRLDKIPITQVSATLAPAGGLAPGASAHLILVAATADNKTYATAGAGGGKVLLDSYTLTTRIVSLNSKGVVSMPSDARVSDGQIGHLTATVVGRPQLSAELDIPVRYDADFTASFSGRAGMDGLNGSDGLDGIPGSDGSTDPNNPSAGGAGGNGGNGEDGKDGDDGRPGPSVSVWVTLRSTPQPALLQARVSSGGKDQYFLIDPERGSLTVISQGGRAGSGGRGGHGGRGGSGGSGWPPGTPGSPGFDGHSGQDGRPGPGGQINATVDPSARAYLGRLHLSSRSGAGLTGPAPVVSIAPVGTLW
jgi:hypothetical protein